MGWDVSLLLSFIQAKLLREAFLSLCTNTTYKTSQTHNPITHFVLHPLRIIVYVVACHPIC